MDFTRQEMHIIICGLRLIAGYDNTWDQDVSNDEADELLQRFCKETGITNQRGA